MSKISRIYSGIRAFCGRGNKNTAKVAEAVVSTSKTKVRPGLPGVTSLERQTGKNLVYNETSTLANNTKKTSTVLYADNGAHIGKGGNEGLEMFRDKTIIREKGASVFGGNRITIKKEYKETMGQTAHEQIIVKDYTPDGVMEHSETITKYRHWDAPKKTVYDRTRSVNGETLYSQTVKSQEAAKQVALDEAKAADAAAKLAREEAAIQLAAGRPRVNVGKVLGGLNVEELKVVEKTLPNGAIKKYYFRPETGPGNRKPVIITYDHSSLHKEWIYNGKQDVIFFKQVGNEKPYIIARQGNTVQVSFTDPNPNELTFANGRKIYHHNSGNRVESQYYNDGNDYARIGRNHKIEKGRVTVGNKEFDEEIKWYSDPTNVTLQKSYDINPRTHEFTGLSVYNQKTRSAAAARVKIGEINNYANERFLNFEELFSPYSING